MQAYYLYQTSAVDTETAQPRYLAVDADKKETHIASAFRLYAAPATGKLVAAIPRDSIYFFETPDGGVKPPGEIIYNLQQSERGAAQFEAVRDAYLNLYGVDLQLEKQWLRYSFAESLKELDLGKGNGEIDQAPDIRFGNRRVTSEDQRFLKALRVGFD